MIVYISSITCFYFGQCNYPFAQIELWVMDHLVVSRFLSEFAGRIQWSGYYHWEYLPVSCIQVDPVRVPRPRLHEPIYTRIDTDTDTHTYTWDIQSSCTIDVIVLIQSRCTIDVTCNFNAAADVLLC